MQGPLEQYTLPTTGRILDFISSATPSGPDANGLFQLTGYNVVVPGDNLTLWVNPWTKHLRQMQVNTTIQGTPCSLRRPFRRSLRARSTTWRSAKRPCAGAELRLRTAGVLNGGNRAWMAAC